MTRSYSKEWIIAFCIVYSIWFGALTTKHQPIAVTSEPQVAPEAPNYTNQITLHGRDITITDGLFYRTNHVETSTGFKLEFLWPHFYPRTLTNAVADKEYGVAFIGKLTCALSCGNLVTFEPGITIPTTNVPCPCGNTNHWLWYFKSE